MSRNSVFAITLQGKYNRCLHFIKEESQAQRSFARSRPCGECQSWDLNPAWITQRPQCPRWLSVWKPPPLWSSGVQQPPPARPVGRRGEPHWWAGLPRRSQLPGPCTRNDQGRPHHCPPCRTHAHTTVTPSFIHRTGGLTQLRLPTTQLCCTPARPAQPPATPRREACVLPPEPGGQAGFVPHSRRRAPCRVNLLITEPRVSSLDGNLPGRYFYRKINAEILQREMQNPHEF